MIYAIVLCFLTAILIGAYILSQKTKKQKREHLITSTEAKKRYMIALGLMLFCFIGLHVSALFLR